MPRTQTRRVVLFEMTDEKITHVRATTFAEEQIMERHDLQRLLCEQIDVVDEDVLIVAEEFSDFTDVHRRIDLLGVDHDGRLVVIELKRTTGGGHMELQALRYAALVSTMKFDRLVTTYERYLASVEPAAVEEARQRLLEWINDAEADEPVLSRDVRIVLVSAGFDPEITTTVLWLNDVHGLDLRCVRVTPYRHKGLLLLDVQPIIPLPEAEELTVTLRERQASVRRAASTDGRDWTPYVVTTPNGTTAPLRKRRAVLALIQGLHEAGVPLRQVGQALPGSSRLISVPGHLTDDALIAAFTAEFRAFASNRRWWFLDAPLYESDRTWLVSKRWGLNTEATLSRLVALAPGFSFEEG